MLAVDEPGVLPREGHNVASRASPTSPSARGTLPGRWCVVSAPYFCLGCLLAHPTPVSRASPPVSRLCGGQFILWWLLGGKETVCVQLC